jgi:hypothetical protein
MERHPKGLDPQQDLRSGPFLNPVHPVNPAQ